jgi:hypothetical protein
MVDAERAAVSRPRCAKRWDRMCYDTVKRRLTATGTGCEFWERFRANGSPFLVLHDTTHFSIQKPHAFECRSNSGRDKAARQRSHAVCGILMHWPSNACPVSWPINLTCFNLCHERTSDHWSDLVHPRSDGLFFSAHGACNRATT